MLFCNVEKALYFGPLAFPLALPWAPWNLHQTTLTTGLQILILNLRALEINLRALESFRKLPLKGLIKPFEGPLFIGLIRPFLTARPLQSDSPRKTGHVHLVKSFRIGKFPET